MTNLTTASFDDENLSNKKEIEVDQDRRETNDEYYESLSEDELDKILFEGNENENNSASGRGNSIDDYAIDPYIKEFFANSYISKKILMLIPRYLCYKGDLSHGFVVNDALHMPIKDAIAYAFYFASLNIKKKKELHNDYEAARDFIIRVIQSNESNEVKEYAKTAFWLFFQGYVEMVTRKFYAYIEHPDIREETIENGISYVWMYIYSKKIAKYDGHVAVTTFFGAFITSWLEECNAENDNASRGRYRQDRLVKKIRDELMVELNREPNLSELVQRTGLNIHQVVESKSRIEHKEKECLFGSLENSDNMTTDDITKFEANSACESPEDEFIKNEKMELMYRAIQSLNSVEQTVFLLCQGMEVINGRIEYIQTETDKRVTDPMKRFNKVAKLLNTNAKDIESIYQRANRKLTDFCGIRRNVKNTHITNQDAFLFFNKKEDDDWVIEFLGIDGFKPD